MSKRPEDVSLIRSPLSSQVIQTVMNSNGVTYEKNKLFGDFIKSFMLLTYNTFLEGVDSKLYTPYQQQLNHFNWCWNQTMMDFANEGVRFNDDNRIRGRIREIMLKTFYIFEDKSIGGTQTKRALSIWLKLFHYDGAKSQSDLDTFLEIYQLFNDSLKGKVRKGVDL
jgi:hypothetical protein